MTVTAMADLLREKLSLSVDLNITQVADAAAEKLNLKLPVNIALKDKLDAAVKSVPEAGTGCVMRNVTNINWAGA